MAKATTTYPLSAYHIQELTANSAISDEVIQERGYVTIERPNENEVFGISLPNGFRYTGGTTRDFLRKLGFPSWATKEGYYYPGLWIPQYTPRGERYAGQWKPRYEVPNRDGKKMKYASARGSSVRLDVHPRWSADRGQDDPTIVPAIVDPSMRLWITEGVKKADALTSRGEVTVALSGVFNWRNTHGSLGDWEDVRLKDREIVICFDADAITKNQVAQAMARLGKWLQHKGAKKIWFCVVPGEVNGSAVKGVDDFFAAGGSLKQLERAFDVKPPRITSTEDKFTDARLAETLHVEVLDGSYAWVSGQGWMEYDGRRYRVVDEVTVLEIVRQWAVGNFADAAQRLKNNESDAASDVEGWRAMLSANRARSVLSLSRGIAEKRIEEFDSDPDLLNTPGGVIHLPTLEVYPHSPDFLFTKITSGSYRKGYRHPDWERAQEVLPKDVMSWLAVRVGQAITGHTTPDGIIPILQGGGENGKGLMTTDGLLPALGDYGAAASPKLFANTKNEHSTERADLRGQRIVIVEELTEGRSIDVTALKQIADVGRIRARRVRENNMEFDASHSIFATTNYVPVINETDHGTWRRLALVKFPYSYVKPGKPLETEFDRRGDPTLKSRIKGGKRGQHDAAVTWAVEGAHLWYTNMTAIEAAHEAGEEAPPSVLLLPDVVEADTRAWRREADRILGFWEECLVPDSSALVLASDLTEAFNAWLAASNHSPWSKETFRPRFAEHMETKRHRVGFKRKARLGESAAHLARRPAGPGSFPAEKQLPKQVDVWSGFRWRTDDTDD